MLLDPTARGSSHIDAVDAPLPKLTPLEKLVRFDLDWNFGPCTGEISEYFLTVTGPHQCFLAG